MATLVVICVCAFMAHSVAGAAAIGPGVDQYFPSAGSQNGPTDGVAPQSGGADAGEAGGSIAAGDAAAQAAEDGAPKGEAELPIAGYPATPLVDVLLVLVLAALATRGAMALGSRLRG